MHAITIPYDMIHVCISICTGVHEGQRLERAVNTIIFFTLLTIAIIHMLTGI